MNKRLQIAGTIMGVLGIILGAFAAHGLKTKITPEALQSFETGVRYQIYHAFLLLIVGNISGISLASKRWIFLLVVIGVLCFSGSIYGLATDALTVFNFKTIALITPLGGLLLISAWVLMLVAFLKKP